MIWSSIEDTTDRVLSVAVSLDSKLLASGSLASKVRIYGVDDQTAPIIQHTFGDAVGRVFSVDFGTDSKLLASGSQAPKVRTSG